MSSKKVVIIGGGPSAKHTAELLVKSKDLEVTMIQANKFVEWVIAIPAVVAKPDLHDKAIAPNPETFQVRGVTYKYGPATSVDAAGKTVTYKAWEGKAEVLPYDALVVCTGFGMPLLYPEVGTTLVDRKAEIQKVSSAISEGSSIVVSGGGLVGVELASNIRTGFPSDKKVVLVCREKVLKTFPEKMQTKVEAVLKKMNIDVVVGSATDAPDDVTLKPGSLNVAGQHIAYDVFLPAYSTGPNTKFLESVPGLLDDKGYIKVNQHLQSSQHLEIFAVGGVSDASLKEAFIAMAKLQDQWKNVATNVKAHLAGKELKTHKEGAPFMKSAPMLILGSGPNAWAGCDCDQFPPPAKCCLCCGAGGFPFCPPPCCMPCCGMCACGYCCGPPEGAGVNRAVAGLRFRSGGFHFKGVGEAPKQQSME